MSTKKRGGNNMETVGIVETAVLTRRTKTHIFNLTRVGKFAGAQKVGGQWRIPRRSVEDYIQECRERMAKLAA